MSTDIRFFAPGIPKAQPRPRAFARRFANGVVSARVYDSSTAEGWKSCIAIAARPFRPASPMEGPVRVDIDFLFPRPKCLMRRKDPDGEFPHEQKPDRDNCDKAVLDCLVAIGMIRDDCQVWCGEVRKLWVAKGGVAGARVRIVETP